MQNRYLLIIILMLPLFLHGMNKVEVKQQVAQQTEQEIKSLDDTPEQKYRIIAQNGSSLEFTRAQLEQSGYFSLQFKDQDFFEHQDLRSGYLKTFRDIRDLQDALRIIGENPLAAQDNLNNFFNRYIDDIDHLINIYCMGVYYGIQPLQLVLRSILAKFVRDGRYLKKIEKLPDDWQKDLTYLLIARKFWYRYILRNESRTLITLEGDIHPYSAVVWSPDKNKVASGGAHDNSLRIWDAMNGKCLSTLQGHTAKVAAIDWYDNHIIVSNSDDGNVRVWDVHTGNCLYNFDNSINATVALSISPDKNKIALGSGSTAEIHDAQSKICLHTLKGHAEKVRRISWSHDNVKIATGSTDKTTRIWDVATGKCLHALSNHREHIQAISWSPDNLKIATGSADVTICIWDAITGNCLRVLKSGVAAIDWSSDGTQILSVGTKGEIRIWDVETGECLYVLPAELTRAIDVIWKSDSIRFTADGPPRKVQVREHRFTTLRLTIKQIQLLEKMMMMKSNHMNLSSEEWTIFQGLPEEWKDVLQRTPNAVSFASIFSMQNVSRLLVMTSILGFGAWLLYKFANRS